MKAQFEKIAYIDSSFLTIKNLLKELGIKASFKSVKDAVCKYPSYPQLSIVDLSSLLSEVFQVENVISSIPLDGLEEVIFPALTFLPLNEGCFVTLANYANEEITFIHPYNGVQQMGRAEFEIYWQQHVLLITDYNEAFEEADLLENIRAEEEECNTFATKYMQLIPDFLSAEECDLFIAYMESGQMSKTPSNENVREKNLVRAFDLNIPEHSRIHSRVLSDVCGITGKTLQHIEKPIFIRYLQKQLNSLHYDVQDEALGKHIYSFVIYLNDDFTGGETYFPQLDKKIHPRKGMAFVFSSFDEHLKTFDCSVHAGLPVKEGAKYTCNIWVSQTPIS